MFGANLVLGDAAGACQQVCSSFESLGKPDADVAKGVDASWTGTAVCFSGEAQLVIRGGLQTKGSCCGNHKHDQVREVSHMFTNLRADPQTCFRQSGLLGRFVLRWR